MDIRRYLDDLEARLDAEQEEKLIQDYYRFADRQWTESYFRPERKPAPSAIEWETMYFNDTLNDYDAMLYKQLLRANDQLSTGGGELLSFRSNFGTGLIPSMLGCEVRVLPREQDSLPGPIHLEWDDITALNEKYRGGWRPDVRGGLG
ncbi:MAG: hypothetical protein IJ100_12225, partial [Lachnospiraceae bacterium]|nr:hypothetical protein [Lachnospiraceae bacterium]